MPDATTQIHFPFAGRRNVRVAFDAEPISSNGGAILLRQADRRLGLLPSLAEVLPDRRNPIFVVHPMVDMLRQRVFQIAQGYEDCNDASTLRRDPVLKACCDRDPVEDADLASQPTLSRLENTAGPKSCYLLGRALLESYFVRHRRRPTHLVLDLDTTDAVTHGEQQLNFFHAYYDEYVYLPLLVFDQDGDLLTAVLQPGKPDGCKTTASVVERIVKRVRQQWPGLRILVRGDSGYASPHIYNLCHRLGLDFVCGINTNARLKKIAERLEDQAHRRYLQTGQKARLFKAVRYRARKGWPRSYRVIIKAEYNSLGKNTRFLVTTLRDRPDWLYDTYAFRGESCENSIKDLKTVLRADRLSCHDFFANQFRLLLHSAAYILLYTLRRAAAGTALAEAQMDTLQKRLLKIGARVQATARRIWLHLSASHPGQDLFNRIARRLLHARLFD